MTDEQLEEILKESRRLTIPAVEKNIFSIGGRGHYENPISDLLAFFLDVHEIHGFGDLVLRSLNEAAGLSSDDIDLIATPQREVQTTDEKRIDILFEGERYVTMIENKIRHWAANPFGSYDAYLNEKYHNKRINRVLLSIRKETPPEGWVSLTYKNLLARIRENLGDYIIKNPYSKWLVLFREFLLNIEQECEPDPMTNERFEFAYKNYQAIYELQKIAIGYIDELLKRGLDAIRLDSDTEESAVFSKKQVWGEHGTALLFHRKNWGGQSNITLLLSPTGLFLVRLYVYDIQDCDVPKLREMIVNDKYMKFWTESKTIRCFGDFENSKLDAILKEIQEVAQILNSYYSS
jgi:hypothetical protein